MIHRTFAKRALAAALFSIPVFALAQTYPDKPVHIVGPYPAGGPVDAYARVIAQSLSTSWGVPVVVENRAGGNAIIATDYVMKQPADGTNILQFDSTAVSINPQVYSKLPYDVDRDIQPVINVLQFGTFLAANASFPPNTLAEFIQLAKSKPGSISYGSFGIGSVTHLTQEELDALVGIKLNHVPYKGAGDVTPALMGGQIEVAQLAYLPMVNGMKAGKIKVYAVAANKRLPLLPDVPTFKELGVPFVALTWSGLAVRKGTPKPIVDKIATDVSKIISTPEFSAKYITPLGFELVNMGPERFGEFIKAEREEYVKYVKRTGVKLD